MNKIFDGVVGIYAQGRNALTDGKPDKKGLCARFLIGGHPDLVLEDRRGLGWKDADGFNVKSRAEVFYDEKKKKIKIVLHKPPILSRQKKKTLVFGVIYNKTIPAYDVVWEVFKPSTISRGAILFVTLINN